MAKVVSFNIESEGELRERSRIMRVKKDEGHTVSVSFKYGTIKFSSRYVEDKKLEGKYIKFYVDTARTRIMWTRLDEDAGYQNPAVLKDYRLIKPAFIKGSKVFSFHISRFMKQAFPLESEKGVVLRKIKVEECIVTHKNNRKFDYVVIV